jgi:PPE-repeat protein
MTAPVWMASPPEIHSAQLGGGPGSGGLLAAAAGWSSLSTTYASVADELTAILAAVQAGAWNGPSAERYVAAHGPYVAWLLRASANSAEAAARHETAATAYTAALAAMPTLPELAANHAIHAVLIATNFFGINTIPIALNEADYARMWVQAATTMATYQAVSGAAVASAPRTGPAPQIQKSASSANSGVQDIVDNDGGNPHELSWWENRFLEVVQTLWRDLLEFPQNPSQALTQLQADIPALVADEVGHAAEAYQAFAPQIQALALSLPVANVGLAGGFAGLSGLAGIQPGAAPVAAVPTPAAPGLSAPTGAPIPDAAAAPATAPASAPSTVPAAAPAVASATPAPPSPPPPGIGGGGYPYLVGGPGMGSGTGMSAGAQRKSPEPDVAAAGAAAGAAARQQDRARRRRRAAMKDGDRGYRYEFLAQDSRAGDVPGVERPERAVTSDGGAGAPGFAGTTATDTAAEAGGLATLTGDGFGGGPSLPMVPGTWEPNNTA